MIITNGRILVETKLTNLRTWMSLVLVLLAVVGFPVHGTQTTAVPQELTSTVRPYVENGQNRFSDSPYSLIALSRSKRLLAVGSSEEVIVWNVEINREVLRLPSNQYTYSVTFSPDEKILVLAGNETRVWNLGTGKIIATANFPPAQKVIFSKNSELAATVKYGDGGFDVRLLRYSSTAESWTVVGDEKFSLVCGIYFVDQTLGVVHIETENGNLLVSNDIGNSNLAEIQPVNLGPWPILTQKCNSIIDSDQRYILTYNEYTNYAVVWPIDSGVKLWKGNVGGMADHTHVSSSMAFMPDGKSVAQVELYDIEGVRTSFIRRYDLFTGEEIGEKVQYDEDEAVLGITDGIAIIQNRPRQFVYGVNLADNSVRFKEDASLPVLTSSALHSTGRYIALSFGTNKLRIFDLFKGDYIFESALNAGIVRFSPSGNLLLLVSRSTLELFDFPSMKPRKKLNGVANVESAAVADDGEVILLGVEDKNSLDGYEHGGRYLYVAAESGMGFGARIGLSESVMHSSYGPTQVAISGDQGIGVAVPNFFIGGGVRLMRGTTSDVKPSASLVSPLGFPFLFVPGTSDLLMHINSTGTHGNLYQIARFDLKTETLRTKYLGQTSHSTSAAVDVTKDRFIAGSADGTLRVWRLSDATLLRVIAPQTSREVALAQNDLAVVHESSRTFALWNIDREELLGHLVPQENGTWIFATPDGRFDTNGSLDKFERIHWQASGEALSVLPLELYLRDYFEPRLLQRRLADEKFAILPPVDKLNRAQPEVRIVSMKVDDARLGLATVTVEVKGSVKTVESTKKRWASGAYDLRLFRDGQLVGQYPEPSPGGGLMHVGSEEERVQWREQHFIELQGGEQGTFHKSFQVRLPRRTDIKEVEFSAYAFNADRVKSETVRRTLPMPEDIEPRAGRAYVVTVGVNASKNPAWDLTYAANDAQVLGETLAEQLKSVRDENTGKARFSEQDVVWVKLVSTVRNKDGKREFLEENATRDKIRAVLEMLSGKAVDRKRLQGVEGVERLEAVRPEDTVILAFSSHGFNRADRFYLLPSDVETVSDKLEAKVLPKAISSDDLTEWLREVDAGEMVMIVDACYSAASVESGEFKPAPLGSRGLGQLAYDKGMRILVASQKDAVAREPEKLQMGYLSYALTKDGLQRRQADFKPEDKRILLSEWLAWAVDRVPKLYKEVQDGTYKDKDIGLRKIDVEAVNSSTSVAQQPTLFDFSRKRELVIDIR